MPPKSSEPVRIVARVAALTLAAAPLFATTAFATAAPRAAAAASDPVVIRLDGEDIHWSELAAWLVYTEGERAADSYIVHQLVEREAARLGMRVDDALVRERIEEQIAERVAGAFNGDRAGWLAEIESLGETEARHIERRGTSVRTELLVGAILGAEREVSEDQVVQLFERRYGRGGRLLFLRALRRKLVVATPPGGGTLEQRREQLARTKARLTEELNALRARAIAGEDVDELVATHGQDPDLAATGGVFPGPFQAAEWPIEVVDAVYALAPGEWTAPLYGRGYFNIFQLVREEQASFDELAPALREELRTRPADAGETARLMSSLRDRAEIRRLPAMSTRGSDPAEPVLLIDDEPVSRDTLARWTLRSGTVSSSVAEFVKERTVRRRAREAGIQPTREAIDARLQTELDAIIETLYKGDRERWLADLRRRGTDEERAVREFRGRVELDLLVEFLLIEEREVAPEHVRATWERRYPHGRELDLRVLRQVVRLDAASAALPEAERLQVAATRRKETQAQLENLRQRALDGEDFGTLAQGFSDDDKTRASGGRYADVFPYWELDAATQGVIDRMQPGQISEPVWIGPAGFLFELTSARDVPFESVAEELEEELRTRRSSAAERSAFLGAMLGDHTYEILDANLP